MQSWPAIPAVLAAALLVPAPAALGAAALEVVSVEIVTPQIDVTSGQGTAVVEVRLRDAFGLPDTITEDEAVVATGGRSRPGPESVKWRTLVRVSGTGRDGVWRGAAVISPAWRDVIFTVSRVLGIAVPDGPSLAAVGGQRWAVTTVRTPVKVVTGEERVRPRARVTNAVTGAPIGGARVRATDFIPWVTVVPGAAADATGLWTSPEEFWADDLPVVMTYGGRRSRGWSLQGAGCLDLLVKLQATAIYPAAPGTAGEPFTVTGNVFPAPVIRRAAGQILLQQLGPLDWLTVAVADPRDNGRYTLTWSPPAPGAYTLRVRWPGAGSPEPCRPQSEGTTLAGRPVTIR
jgi:hypothetical protein